MIAYVLDICPSCGNLKSVCSDGERAFYPQRSMCYASGVRDLTRRRLEKKHGHAEGIETLHPLDGLGVWVSAENLTPDDDFV